MIRGQKVMLDSDLAELYGVETKVLNQSVRRNTDRFPQDFMFQLTPEEYQILKSQIVTSKKGCLELKVSQIYFPLSILLTVFTSAQAAIVCPDGQFP